MKLKLIHSFRASPIILGDCKLDIFSEVNLIKSKYKVPYSELKLRK